MIRREDAQFEFGAGGGVGRVGGRKFQVGGVLVMEHLNFHGTSKVTIDFGTVLDAVNADELFGRINPVEDAVVADAELAESGQIHRHPDEPAMHHVGGVFREPLDFTFHSRAHDRVQPGELRVRHGAYFGSLGHGWWRGVQSLYLPAKSSKA